MNKFLKLLFSALLIAFVAVNASYADDNQKSKFGFGKKSKKAVVIEKYDPIKNGYTDINQSHWAYTKIDLLTKNGVLVGYPDGTFRPDEFVTRAEFATMVIKALVLENTPLKAITDFKDVDCAHWAYNMIQRAAFYDLVKGNPDGNFYPESEVLKSEALSVVVSSLTTEHLSVLKAQQVLEKIYTDYVEIPEWFVVTAGKAEIIGLIVRVPGQEKIMNAQKAITRGEIAALLFNMMEEAKLNPNKKIAEAMRPKKGDGIVIPEAIINGSVATLPAGTVIPVVLVTPMSSQTNEAGEIFLANAPQNLISKESFIIVLKGTNVAGEVDEAKVGRLFVRNGKLVMSSDVMSTPIGQKASMAGVVDTTVKRNWIARILRAIFKGGKINLEENQVVNVKLSEPLNIDITTGWIIE